MTWFKVDDSFYDHPKVFDAPDCAVALWTRAGSWAARNLTDGFVPAGMPARLCDDPDTAVRELVRRGLWSRTKDGYRFHEWLERNPSAEDVKEQRSKRAEAGRKGGLASGKVRSKPGSKVEANASANASVHASRTVEPPTRPDPPPSKEGGEGARATLREAQRAAPSDNPDRRGHRSPVLGDETRRRAAEARAAIRKPETQQRRVGSFAELLAATNPPPDTEPPDDNVIPIRGSA